MEFRRPPLHTRPKLDLGYRITGQGVERLEIRPNWLDSSQQQQHSVATATYVRTKDRWRVVWMRRDLKWHGYVPSLEVRSLEAFLAVVRTQEHRCFFG
jgi:hypothetical protein